MASLSGWRLRAVALLLGVTLALGHLDSASLGALSFVAIALGAYGLQGRNRGFAPAWWFGLGYFGFSMQWIIPPFFVDPATVWLAPFAFLGMAGGLALFWGAAGWLAVRFFERGWQRALGWALAWVFVEYLRANILTGFPWAHPFYLTHQLPISQLASFIGIHGGFVVVAACLSVLSAFKRGYLALLPLIAIAIWGGLRIAPDDLTRSEPLVVRVIQPEVAQHLKWQPDFAAEFYQRRLDLSTAPAELKPDLVIWPETSLYFGGRDHTEVFDEISKTIQAPLIAGFNSGDYYEFQNSMIYLGLDGEALQYDKHHLVPFGEYFPMSDLASKIGLRGLAELATGYTKGEGPVTLRPAALPDFTPLICYEAIFPSYAKGVGERAEFIVNITNDAWFGAFIGPRHHLTQARFRAIESGLPMLRAANKGMSAIIDAKGRIIAKADLGQAGFAQAGLPAALQTTFYSKWGDWPAILLWLAALAYLAVRRKKD